MCGGSSTSTSSVQIPPEVLARYNSVNTRAEEVAQNPFENYSGQFVAGLNPTQSAGINATNAAASQAQPYFGAATQGLSSAQQGGSNYIGSATNQLGAAQQAGEGLGAVAGQQYYTAQDIGNQYAGSAGQQYGQAMGLAQPYYQAATQGTQAALQGAQPYQGLATQAALAGGQAIDPSQLQVGQYMSPFTQNVVNATQAAMGQQFGQQNAQQQAEAIRSGAFGGDRAGLQRATLQGQQALAASQVISPLYQQAYNQALQTAQQQQGVGLGAAQANRAAMQQTGQQLAALGQQGFGQQLSAAQQAQSLGQGLYGQALGTGQAIQGLGQQQYNQTLGTGQAQAALGQQQYGQNAQTAQQLAALGQQAYTMGAGTSQQLANLGSGAQQAALQGSQAQIAAGTVEQQTKQADLTAQYQQFLQKQGYPFQTAQFLANIAMGTGALSGSTTSTTQPAPFFSDERLKHDAKKIGETNDGLPIYSFKYNGDDRTQIGLMAQDVEKKKPEAVGLAPASDGRMYKTVDYDKATRAKRADGGGLIPPDYSSMGGAVGPDMMGEGFARGGYAMGGPSLVSPSDQKAMMANLVKSKGPYGNPGFYGAGRHDTPGLGGAKIDMGMDSAMPTPSLVTASPIGEGNANQIGLGAQALQGLKMVDTGKGAFNTGKSLLIGSAPTTLDPEGARGLIGGQGKFSGNSFFHDIFKEGAANGGFIVDDNNGGTDEAGNVTPGLTGGIPNAAGKKAAQLAVAKSPSGSGRGVGNDIADAASLAKTGYDIIKFLPTIFAADGGAIGRKGYAGTNGESGAVVEPGLAPANDVAASNAGPDYRSMVENAAKKNGIDVDHAVRLSHGESRLRPIVGDDGSSAGLFQLHVGGLSKQYPHPGLGDEYFKQRQPDLANKLSPSEKIAFLNAPENQADTADFATGHIAKNGAGAWTIARQQGLFGLPGEAPSRGLDVGSLLPNIGRSGPGKYNGKAASDASLGDIAAEFLPSGVPTSSNFWVPALSGLGSMLGSKSHTLAGAIGEGLVGGVSGYQSQKKQEQETVKNIFDMVKGRFTQTMDDNGNVVFRDNIAGTMVQPGQVQAAVSNMLTSAGIDPAPYGLGRVQSADASRIGTNAATRQITDAGAEKKVEAKPTEGAVSKPVEEWNPGDFRKDVFQNPEKYGFTVGGENDPNVRLKDIKRDRELARKAAIGGFKDEASRINLQAQEKEKMLNDQVKESYSSDLARVDQQRKDTQANANTYVQDIKKSSDAYPLARQQAIKLSEAFAKAQMGPGSDVKAYVTGLAKTFGFSLPEKFNSDADAIAYANKLAMKNVVEQAAASNLLRAPKAVLGSMEQINATSKMDPNAAYRLLGDMIGEMDYTHKRNVDYLEKNKGKEPAAHGAQYDAQQGDKGYKTILAKAYSDIAVPKDPNAANTVRDVYRDLGEYGYKHRELKPSAGQSGGEAKSEAPSATTIPTPLQSVEGLQYSASRNQYRDKAGNVYDASGKRVQ